MEMININYKLQFKNSAYIQIGKREIINNDSNADIYIYPENITELELCENIKLDMEYYENIFIQLPLPAHLRFMFIQTYLNSYKGGNIYALDKLD